MEKSLQADSTVLTRFLDRMMGLISVVAVLGMLTGAVVIVCDVLMRWFFGTAIIALNEIMSMVFAIAVSATLASGVVRDSNLRVDLLAAQTGTKVRAWLYVIGMILMTLVFAILAWRIFGTAEKMFSQGRATIILELPLAFVHYVVSGFIGLAAVVQALKVIQGVKTALNTSGDERSTKPVIILLWVLFLSVSGVALYGFFDFDGMASFVRGHPGLSVIIAFLFLWLGILAQLHLAGVMGMVGLVGASMFVGGGSAANVYAQDAMEFMMNSQVATLPLFLMMGSFCFCAGISDDIYAIANAFLGRIRGGLAYATVAGCAGFGAVSGSSVATAATFGRIALPEMKKHGYSPRLAAGSVAAGGTLGALVPPSGAIILFALLTEESIGRLFVAAMIPAVLALLLYFAAIFITVRMHPEYVPDHQDVKVLKISETITKAFPVILLFVVVIGGLYAGFFTATESAAVGAVGAFLVALARGRLNRKSLLSVLSETTLTTALIYGLIFGALIFSFFVGIGQAAEFATQWIASFDVAPVVILICLLVFYLLLGSVMDSFAVMVITIPVVTPIILTLGYDMIHWGVLMLVIVEIGMITPPFGMNLFILKSIDPDSKLSDVLYGVVPFIMADIVKLILLIAFPVLSLWLPNSMG